jgi:hypothetical protein
MEESILNKLKITWKEAAVAYFEVTFQYLFRAQREITKNLSQYPRRDLNFGSSEYEQVSPSRPWHLTASFPKPQAITLHGR